jgi:hypothetical protein
MIPVWFLTILHYVSLAAGVVMLLLLARHSLKSSTGGPSDHLNHRSESKT